MNAAGSAPCFSFNGADQWPTSDALNIAALYEDFAAGIRLREALDWLSWNLAPLRVTHQAWNFAMLARLDVRAAALRETADADLIIIAAQGDDVLPDQIKRWLERCMVENGRVPGALVELHHDELDQSGLPPASLTSELMQLASRWHMDFIGNGQFDEWLNADYARQLMRRSESSLYVPNESRLRFATVAAGSMQPRRERLAI